MRSKTLMVASVLIGISACHKQNPDVVAMPGRTASASDSMVAIADVAPSGVAIRDTPPPPPPVHRVRQPEPRPQQRPEPVPVSVAPQQLAPAAPAPQLAVADVAPVIRRPHLSIGTPIEATAIDSVHSRYTKEGDIVRVRVNRDVTSDGNVIIPAGSIVNLSVDAIDPPGDGGGDRGTLVLTARDVEINGTSFPLSARASDYQSEVKSRGIGPAEVAKTGAGAVVGGILGRVIGGNKTGTIVGALGGAAGGAVIAANTATHDLVVHAGTNVTLTVSDDFALTRGKERVVALSAAKGFREW